VTNELYTLLSKLSSPDLIFLAYDYVPAVYAKLTKQTVKEELIKRLVQYGDEKQLLTGIKKIAPDVYAKHFPQIAPRLDADATNTLLFKLQIQQFNGNSYVQVLESVTGETKPEPFAPPFKPESWPAIAKALKTKFGMVAETSFNQAEQQTLIAEKMLKMGKFNYLLHTLYRQVGERLYESLLPPLARESFKVTLTTAQREDKAVTFRLIFDQAATVESAYPWELLFAEGQFLLSTGYVNLTRYIAFNQPATSLEVDLPIKVLFIPAHPSDLPKLSAEAERNAIVKGLREQIDTQQVKFEVISAPTRQELVNCLQIGQYDYVHFDGHGMFGYICHSCGQKCLPTSIECSNCGYPVGDESPQGYLAFENPSGSSDFVRADTLRATFARSKVKLVVLSACSSSSVGGETLFGGAGPSLIQVGVPAVVSMQFPIPVTEAVDYFRQFYQTLADGQGLIEAVRRGRQLLQNDQANPQTWFIPTLYLRYKN